MHLFPYVHCTRVLQFDLLHVDWLLSQRLNRTVHHELDVSFDHQAVDQTNDDWQRDLIHDRNQALVLSYYKLVWCSVREP